MACWEQLSVPEKEACFDPKSIPRKIRGNGILSLKAWNVRGKLATEWLTVATRLAEVAGEQDVREQLMLKDQHRGVSGIAAWKLFLVGRKPRWKDLKPTIVAVHTDIEVAKRAATVFQALQNGVLSTLLYGYNFTYDQEIIKLCSETTPSMPNMAPDADTDAERSSPKISLCGAHMIIYSRGSDDGAQQDSEEVWSHSTIGGTLMIKGKPYAVTAAHAFPESWSQSGDAARTCEVYLHSSQFRSMPSDISSARSNWRVYSGEMRTLISPDQLVGIQVNRDNDWALVPVDNPRFSTTNFIELADGEKLHVHGSTAEAPSGPLLVVSGVSNPSPCTLDGVPSIVSLPGSQKFSLAWTLNRRSAVGDCGSWVIDDKGQVFGMVIATSESENLTFCLPFSNILSQIFNTFGGNDSESGPWATRSESDSRASTKLSASNPFDTQGVNGRFPDDFDLTDFTEDEESDVEGLEENTSQQPPDSRKDDTHHQSPAQAPNEVQTDNTMRGLDSASNHRDGETTKPAGSLVDSSDIGSVDTPESKDAKKYLEEVEANASHQSHDGKIHASTNSLQTGLGDSTTLINSSVGTIGSDKSKHENFTQNIDEQTTTLQASSRTDREPQSMQSDIKESEGAATDDDDDSWEGWGRRKHKKEKRRMLETQRTRNEIQRVEELIRELPDSDSTSTVPSNVQADSWQLETEHADPYQGASHAHTHQDASFGRPEQRVEERQSINRNANPATRDPSTMVGSLFSTRAATQPASDTDQTTDTTRPIRRSTFNQPSVEEVQEDDDIVAEGYHPGPKSSGELVHSVQFGVKEVHIWVDAVEGISTSSSDHGPGKTTFPFNSPSLRFALLKRELRPEQCKVQRDGTTVVDLAFCKTSLQDIILDISDAATLSHSENETVNFIIHETFRQELTHGNQPPARTYEMMLPFPWDETHSRYKNSIEARNGELKKSVANVTSQGSGTEQPVEKFIRLTTPSPPPSPVLEPAFESYTKRPPGETRQDLDNGQARNIRRRSARIQPNLMTSTALVRREDSPVRLNHIHESPTGIKTPERQKSEPGYHWHRRSPSPISRRLLTSSSAYNVVDEYGLNNFGGRTNESNPRKQSSGLETRVHRKDVDPATLDHYMIPWRWDNDDFYIIVEEKLTDAWLDELELHTRGMIRDRQRWLAHHQTKHRSAPRRSTPGNNNVNSNARHRPTRRQSTFDTSISDPDRDYVLRSSHAPPVYEPSARTDLTDKRIEAQMYLDACDALDNNFELAVRDLMWDEGVPMQFCNDLFTKHKKKEQTKKDHYTMLVDQSASRLHIVDEVPRDRLAESTKANFSIDDQLREFHDFREIRETEKNGKGPKQVTFEDEYYSSSADESYGYPEWKQRRRSSYDDDRSRRASRPRSLVY